MNFEKIDMNNWKRKPIYDHFINDVKCVMTLTADVDVTQLLKVCQGNGYKFYPVYIYLVTTIVNRHEEFKMGYDKEGSVGVYKKISPSYIVFNKEDETFTRLVSDYNEDFETFYNQVVNDTEKFKDKRGFEVDFSNRDTFSISCLPWIAYKAFDLHVFDDGTYLSPIITWGKYELNNDKMLMPLTIQLHHAVADGYHLSNFFEEIERETQVLVEYLTK